MPTKMQQSGFFTLACKMRGLLTCITFTATSRYAKFSGTLGPVTIALDPWSDVYTTDNNPSGGLITAYTPERALAAASNRPL